MIPSFVNYRSNMTSLLLMVQVKKNLLFFKELVLNLPASTGIFRTKSKLIFDFCLFLDLKHILKNLVSQALLVDK